MQNSNDFDNVIFCSSIKNQVGLNLSYPITSPDTVSRFSGRKVISNKFKFLDY